MSYDPCVWYIPSWPEIQAATDGIARVLVHEQNTTAASSSGARPACSTLVRAAPSASSSSDASVYVRCAMPVFVQMSFAVIGDQQSAALRTRSSLLQTTSPRQAARDSMRGMVVNRRRTSTGGTGIGARRAL